MDRGVDRYVISEGAARLRVLSRFWAASTEALLDRVEVGPGARCLDVGCGAGDVTVDLARRAGPSGHALGIDLDPSKLTAAREYAAGLGVDAQTRFSAANVYDLDTDGSFDVVYCRFVLEHVSRPVDLLERMWACVAPGGALVVEDADFDAQFCYPPHPAFDFWVQNYPTLLRHAGGDPQIGQKLPSLFAAAGIPSPDVTIAQRAQLTGEDKILCVLTLEATASAMQEAGIASSAQTKAALDQLRELVTDPSVLIGSPRMCQIWSRRR